MVYFGLLKGIVGWMVLCVSGYFGDRVCWGF